MSRVLLAAPVRDRGWILPAYLEHLANLRIPDGVELDAWFLVNGQGEDGGPAMLERFAQQVAGRIAVEVERFAEAPPAPPTRETENRLAIFDYLARLRNATLERALEGGYDHLLSVDSDILLPPHALERLLGHRRDLVAATVVNDEFWGLPVRYRNTNMLRRAPYPGPDGGTAYVHVLDLPGDGLVDVDVTGACMLLSRGVLEAGCRFAHHPAGEDIPFCEQVAARGFRLYGDAGLRVDHMMGQHTFIAPPVLAGTPQPNPYVIQLLAGDRPRVDMVYGPEASRAAMGRIWARLLLEDAQRGGAPGLPAGARIEGLHWDHAAEVILLRLSGGDAPAAQSPAPPRSGAAASRRGHRKGVAPVPGSR